MHDIGLITVPDTILQKPGPLTPEEWEVVKSHPYQGYRILENVSFLSDARKLVLLHHEHWDGNGYPLGLKREQIPKAVSVLALAESFSALREPRSYRPPREQATAREEIAAASGKRFDPQVVESFLRIPAAEWETPARRFPEEEPGSRSRSAAPSRDRGGAMKRRSMWFSALVVVAIAAAGAARFAGAVRAADPVSTNSIAAIANGELTIFAASSLQEAFHALADRFTKASGTAVRLSFAGSQELRTQLEEGAQADLFASADRRHAEALQHAGIVLSAEIVRVQRAGDRGAEGKSRPACAVSPI